MPTSAEDANLKNIPVDRIDRNPENPRLVFRPEEMEQLLDSINRHGVQVPISVYRDGRRYVLIDGERRWRCCVKLNQKTIPALIQEKPAHFSLVHSAQENGAEVDGPDAVGGLLEPYQLPFERRGGRAACA